MTHPTVIYSALPSGSRERIRSFLALRLGPSVRRMRRGEAMEVAADLGVTSAHVSTVACLMRKGQMPERGKTVMTIGSLPERLHRLEMERPGLTRLEQAVILGTTHGAVRDAAYRLRLMGGHAPCRIVRKRSTKRGPIVPATGWRP